MNLSDAADITYPFREQPIDPPQVRIWTDDDERNFDIWRSQESKYLLMDFLRENAERYEDFCRDKFDAGRALDSDLARADAELDAEKERL